MSGLQFPDFPTSAVQIFKVEERRNREGGKKTKELEAPKQQKSPKAALLEWRERSAALAICLCGCTRGGNAREETGPSLT